ncbi:MAG: hypothetical protein JWM64_2428 [Frankiales bacterium]|nr:hypothetical protein [Frankiales bacterium]
MTARAWHKDDGTTLAELAVTMVVFSIFAIFLSTTTVQSFRLTSQATTRETAVQQASLVMAQVSKDLRTALRVGPPGSDLVAFTSATPTQVSFYSSVEPGPVLEVLRTTLDGKLMRDVTLPDAGSTYPDLKYSMTDPSRTTTRSVAANGLIVTGIFTYQLQGSPTPVTTVAAAQLKNLVAVNVRVTVDGDGGSGRVQPVVLENTVRPYNL